MCTRSSPPEGTLSVSDYCPPAATRCFLFIHPRTLSEYHVVDYLVCSLCLRRCSPQTRKLSLIPLPQTVETGLETEIDVAVRIQIFRPECTSVVYAFQVFGRWKETISTLPSSCASPYETQVELPARYWGAYSWTRRCIYARFEASDVEFAKCWR